MSTRGPLLRITGLKHIDGHGFVADAPHMGQRRRKSSSRIKFLEIVANPLVLLLLAWAWVEAPAPDLVAVVAAGALLYFLFFMLRVCNAVNKDRSFCGNNAHGLIRGCHYKRHRVQARWRFVPTRLRPVSVQQAFANAAPRRPVVQAPPAQAQTASAATSGSPVASEALDILGIIEVLLAAGSFAISLVQVLLA